MGDYFSHSSAVIDEGATIGANTKIWHFSHISSGAIIGDNCNFGQNVFIASGVIIGNNVKVQNNVSIYTGTTIEDGQRRRRAKFGANLGPFTRDFVGVQRTARYHAISAGLQLSEHGHPVCVRTETHDQSSKS